MVGKLIKNNSDDKLAVVLEHITICEPELLLVYCPDEKFNYYITLDDCELIS